MHTKFDKWILGITCLLAIFTGLGFLHIAHIRGNDGMFSLSGYSLLLIAMVCGSFFYTLTQPQRQIN